MRDLQHCIYLSLYANCTAESEEKNGGEGFCKVNSKFFLLVGKVNVSVSKAVYGQLKKVNKFQLLLLDTVLDSHSVDGRAVLTQPEEYWMFLLFSQDHVSH